MPKYRNHGLRKRCGCPRVKWPKCRHGWHLNLHWKGQSYRLSLDRECGRHISSKTEAQAEADRIRDAIRNGVFRQPQPRQESVWGSGSSEQGPDITFAECADLFLKGHSQSPMTDPRRTGENGTMASWRDDRAMLRTITDFLSKNGRLGDRPVSSVAHDDVKEFMRHLMSLGRAVSTRKHYLRIWKLMGRWAMAEKYRVLPFITEEAELRQGQPAMRRRRLRGDEEQRLLKAANPRLYRLIVAALETGARRGELLSGVRSDVNLERREFTFPAGNTKDGEERVIPITHRLAAVLEMARLGPDGTPLRPDACVFGNEVGEPIKSVKTAWGSTLRRAGIDDLRFHDLRHEAASRWLEGGVPIHHVQALLGHSNVKQTSTYLNVCLDGLKNSMKNFEANRLGLHTVCTKPPVVPADAFPADEDTPDKSLTN